MSSLRNRAKSSRALRTGAFLAQNAIQALRPSRLRPPGGDGARRYQLAAMIRVKDEARFLPEWLAHHIGLGVEHVVVYDNNSSDGTRDLIDPFVQEGFVTHVPWPTVPASPSSHLDFFARFGPSCRWAAFFDADEFLVESTPGGLAAILDSAGNAPAIAINTRYFGSAGHEVIPDGLVTERFDRADAGYDRHVKVVARPAEVAGYRNPHNFYYRRGRLARTPDGRRVYGSFVTPSGRPALVINHYVYRSREDYERKAGPRHGYSTAVGARDRQRRLELASTQFHLHNEVAAKVPEATLQTTADMLRKLGYPQGLHRPATG